MVSGDYDDFFRQVLPRAVGVAKRVTGERASAEDAAIEALARAHLHWQRIGVLPWREAWVLRVAARQALRHLPKQRTLTAMPAASDEAESVAFARPWSPPFVDCRHANAKPSSCDTSPICPKPTSASLSVFVRGR